MPIPKFIRLLVRILSWIENVRNYVLSNKYVRYALRKRLFTAVPLVILSVQMYFTRQNLAERTEEILHLSEEREFLIERLSANKRRFDDLEFSVWEKLYDAKRGPIMLNVNSYYAKTFLSRYGLDKRDYIGKPDSAIYPKEMADLFKKEDSLVAHTGERLFAINNVQVDSGKTDPVLIVKWRKIDSRDTVVLGAAIRIESIFNQIQKLQENRFD